MYVCTYVRRSMCGKTVTDSPTLRLTDYRHIVCSSTPNRLTADHYNAVRRMHDTHVCLVKCMYPSFTTPTLVGSTEQPLAVEDMDCRKRTLLNTLSNFFFSVCDGNNRPHDTCPCIYCLCQQSSNYPKRKPISLPLCLSLHRRKAFFPSAIHSSEESTVQRSL